MTKQRPPHADLIAECLSYCGQAGIKPSTFGAKAVNDGDFIPRLERGGRCWPETEEKVRQFMQENPPSSGEAA